jgi:hypothetical protein
MGRRNQDRPVGSPTGVAVSDHEFADMMAAHIPPDSPLPVPPDFPVPASVIENPHDAPDPVTFVETPAVQPVTTASLLVKNAEAAAQASPIKVRVNKPFRVVHGGNVFLGGQTLSVPDDEEHSRWIQSGWVTKVKGK